MLPAIAWSMSLSEGWGFSLSSAVAATIWPDWHEPHRGTSRLAHAACTFLPTSVAPTPSMVVIFLPPAADNGVLQERIGLPSKRTVQAPHSAAPQPNLVPVMPRVSRSTQRSGVLGSASTSRVLPLM